MHAALANAVLAFHVAIVLFVVVGLIVIVAGNFLDWHWVNRPWFRVLHLATIAIVVAESWLGITCPFTTLESWLRAQAGQSPSDVDFIQYWLQRILFYEGPPWVFTLAYSVFGALVAATCWYFPPARTHREGQ